MKKKMSDVLQDVFKEQEDFIIVGLTGRTGSGSSTVAEILTKQKLELKEPINCEDITNEERKYRIIYNFINNKWQPFTKIQVGHIITSFVLDYNEDFLKLLKDKYHIEENPEIRSKYDDIKHYYRENHLKLTEELIDDENIEKIYSFYFNELPIFNQALKDFLDNQYTVVYQDLGDSIRSTGNIIKQAQDDNMLFCLSERINLLIKVARDFNKDHDRKDYFVIDAIRNPFEALFFKQRFSAFYLVSISTPDLHRLNRLVKIKQLSYKQVEELNKREYPKGPGLKNNLVVINIQKCIENSDIHIENPDNEIPGDYSNLNYLLGKYISLMMHPGLVTPTKIERCMQVAFTTKFNSGCISRQVGAVVTDQDYSIKSVGWNDSPYGHTPCRLRSVDHLITNHDEKAYSDYELTETEYKDYFKKEFEGKSQNEKLTGLNLTYCFKDVFNGFKDEENQVYTRSLHAEENAFLQIAKYGGQGIQNGILFSTASPCDLCSKKAYQLGIKKIIYIDPYPGIAQRQILNCGNRRPVLELFSGAIGRAYHKLYEPIMSYKDELAILIGEADE